MPYIEKEGRRRVLMKGAQSAGELNYLFTYWIKKYICDNGKKYQTYNDIIGALEGCKLEIYRREISPYEDMKMSRNGDVHFDSN